MLFRTATVVGIILSLAAAAYADPAFTTITAEIAPVRLKDQGQLIVALYDNKDAFPKLDQALRKTTIPATTDTVRVAFDSISPGAYALIVIHDKNENGKLDMRWFPWPKPKEGTGVSNNDKGRPKFDKSRFDVEDAPVSLKIHLRY